MKQTRREFLRGAIVWGGLLCAGSLELTAVGRNGPAHRAFRYLADRQSPDGAWRSTHYAAFREGDVLTPLILWALQPAAKNLSSSDDASISGHQHTSAIQDPWHRGLQWLRNFTDQIRAEDDPWSLLRYPLFTASYATQVFARINDSERASVWVKILRQLRTSEALGWPTSSPLCGAWSDASRPPRYVDPVPDMLAPNISATALAITALTTAGDANLGFSARPFLECCQNFTESNPSEFDDGGFFFALDDPIRNKAGTAGRDANGRLHFHSYGSATCDGWLALRSCGLPKTHPRLQAATQWLRRNSHDLTLAGDWSPNRAEAQASLIFYQAQALAAVLQDLGPDQDWTHKLRHSLTNSLLDNQLPNGSWQGPAPDSCEDDPLLATAFATRALSLL